MRKDIKLKIQLEFEKFIQNSAEIKKAFEEIIAYEKRTTNKTSQIYNIGLQKRINELRKHVGKVKAIESYKYKDLKNILKDYDKFYGESSKERLQTLANEAEQAKVLSAQLSKQQTGVFKKVGAAVSTYASKLKRAFGTLSRYFISYTLLFAVKDAISSIVNTILEVNDKLAKFNALTLASLSTMKKIKDTVYGVSAQYGIAAQDVANFTVEMAKLGETADEINNIASYAASLSVILGESMQKSGQLIVTVANQYQMSVKQADYITANLLNTIKSSPADINGLVRAFQYAGTTAVHTGISFKELNNMIIILAKNGIKMQKIGTGLRNVLAKLAAKYGDINQGLRELYQNGLSVGEAEQMFGKRGMNVAMILANQYDWLMKLNKQAIPMYIEQQIRASNALDSFKSQWGRFTAMVKAWFGAGGEEAKRTLQAFDLNDYIRSWKKLGLEQSRLIEILDNGVKKGKSFKDVLKSLHNIEVAKIMKDQNISKELASKELSMYYIKLIKNTDALKGLYNKQKELLKQQQEITRVEGKLKKATDIFLNAPEHDRMSIKSIKDFEKSIGISKESIVKTLTDFGFSVTDAEDIAEKELHKAYSRFLANNKKSLEYFKTTIASLKNEILKIRKEAAEKGGGLSDSQRELIKEKLNRIKELESYVCFVTTGEISCKKGMKRVDHAFDIALQRVMDAFRSNKEKIRKQFASMMAGFNPFSQTNINGRKGIISFSDFLKNAGFDQSKNFIGAKTDMAEEWAQQQNAFIDKLKEKAREDFANMVDLLQSDKDVNKINLTTTLKSLEALKNKELAKPKVQQNQLHIKALNHDISVVQTQLATLTDEYDKQYKDLKRNLDVYLNALDKKKDKIETTVQDTSNKDEKAKADYIKDVHKKMLTELESIYSKFNSVILDNYLRRLAAEKAAMEAHYREQDDILKAQLHEHLITEGQYELRRRALEKKRVEEENKINKAQFEAKKKSQIADILVKETVAFAETYMMQLSTKGLAGIPIATLLRGIIAAETAAAIGAVLAQKFYPVKYETGGWLYGLSHAAGGIPIGGAEAENGEFIVNKVSAKKNASLIEEINANPDFTDKLIEALQSAKIRAYFTDVDFDAAERNKKFNENSVNYMRNENNG